MLCASLNGARQSPAKRAGRLETLLGHRREVCAQCMDTRWEERRRSSASTTASTSMPLRSWMPACAKVTSSHGAPGGQRDGGAVGLHDRCRPEAASYRPAWLYGVNTTDSFHHPLSGGGGDPISLDNAGLASRAAVPKSRPVASRTTT